MRHRLTPTRLLGAAASGALAVALAAEHWPGHITLGAMFDTTEAVVLGGSAEKRWSCAPTPHVYFEVDVASGAGQSGTWDARERVRSPASSQEGWGERHDQGWRMRCRSRFIRTRIRAAKYAALIAVTERRRTRCLLHSRRRVGGECSIERGVARLLSGTSGIVPTP